MDIYTKAGAAFALNVIEEEFGRRWLEAQKKRDSPRTNPVRRTWRKTVAFVGDGSPDGTPINDPNVADLVKFGIELSYARALPHYSEAIPLRLKGDELEKVKYEAYVGHIIARRAVGGEFIPCSSEPGVRTADLLLRTESEPIHIECKRKERYVTGPGAADPQYRSLASDVVKAIREAGGSFEICCFIPGGLEEGWHEQIVTDVKSLLKAGRTGLSVNTDNSIGLLIRPFELPANLSEPVYYYLPTSKGGSHCEVIVDDPKAVRKVYGFRTCHTFLLDAYKLKTIVNTFNHARGQIPGGSSGIIYVDLDISNLRPYQILPYLDCMSASVGRLFTPTDNRRVSAVAFTTHPVFTPMTLEDGSKAIGFDVIMAVIENPFALKKIEVPRFEPFQNLSRTELYGGSVGLRGDTSATVPQPAVAPDRRD